MFILKFSALEKIEAALISALAIRENTVYLSPPVLREITFITAGGGLQNPWGGSQNFTTILWGGSQNHWYLIWGDHKIKFYGIIKLTFDKLMLKKISRLIKMTRGRKSILKDGNV